MIAAWRREWTGRGGDATHEPQWEMNGPLSLSTPPQRGRGCRRRERGGSRLQCANLFGEFFQGCGFLRRVHPG
jgi:hypothetical protein